MYVFTKRDGAEGPSLSRTFDRTAPCRGAPLMADYARRYESKRRGGHVLMLAAAFPPTGGPGVQRSVKFAKYLPEFGWRPTVWTLDHMDGLPQDPTLLDDLPDSVTVRRWGGGGGIRAVQRSLRGCREAGGISSRIAQAVDWRLNEWNARMLLPDDWARWAGTSTAPLRHLIERERVGVLYSTFSPASNHLLGLNLKRRTGLPWVADFRDLWTDDFRYCEPSRRRQRAHRKLEQDILEAADVVIGVTTRQTSILSRYVPHSQNKFRTITNGFDAPDFPNGTATTGPVRGNAKAKTFVLAHVGRLDRWRTNAAWFEGLRRFVSGISAERDKCILRIVGYANSDARQAFVASGARCQFAEYTSHAEAIREMRGADALLLIVPDGRNADSVIPAKIFEYLAAGRPILVVGPQGSEPESIVRSCEAGITVPFDAEAIARALDRLFADWKAHSLMHGCERHRIECYTRRHLTRRLADIFDGLVRHEATLTASCAS